MGKGWVLLLQVAMLVFLAFTIGHDLGSRRLLQAVYTRMDRSQCPYLNRFHQDRSCPYLRQMRPAESRTI